MRQQFLEMLSSGQLLQIIGGAVIVLFWYAFYILTALRAARDGRFGAPAVAVALMWSYDFTFTFIYPADPQALRLVLFTWLLTDSVLLLQVFRYGARSYPYAPLRTSALWVSLGTLIACFTGLLAFVGYYQLFTGDVVAYIVDAFLSVLLLVMAVARPALLGISLAANAARFAADLLAAVVTWLTDPFTATYEDLGPQGDNNPLTLFLFVLMIVCDLLLLTILLRGPKPADPITEPKDQHEALAGAE